MLMGAEVLGRMAGAERVVASMERNTGFRKMGMNTTGLQDSVPLVLAIQNEGYRERLAGLVQKIGFHLEQVGASGIVHRLTREQYTKSWLLLDTEDDVAWLV